MSRYKIFIFIAIILSWARIVRADFIITEIMYDPSGSDQKREWIEVENVGTIPDDLSKWYFFSDNTKHMITPENAYSGSPIIAPGTYAVISQNTQSFRLDWPNYNSSLFDSSWTSFNNKGENIALKDPLGNIKSTVTFSSGQGGTGNGDSLQLIDNAWQGAHPTPGALNKVSPSPIVPIEMPIPLAVANVQKNKVEASLPSDSHSSLVGKENAKSNTDSTSMPINLNDLGASSANTKIDIGQNSPWIAWTGLAVVIASGISILLYTKRKIRKNAELAGDFSADDFTLEK